MDWYCCAGGSAMGYWHAIQDSGIRIIGVDKKYQPHYPFAFFEGDAREAMDVIISGGYWNGIGLEDIAANHGSPPCQKFTRYRNLNSVRVSTDEKYEDLIPDTRERFQAMGLPYVIENVPGAPLVNPAQLCGTSFWIPVRRHRWFELGNWDVPVVPDCRHERYTDRIFPGSTNRPNGRTVCNVGEYRVPLKVQKEAMQVDWPVTLREISEMVPPAMTKWLGERLLESLG
jgi:DNA (cytosine-5)-methyltransferase 1